MDVSGQCEIGTKVWIDNQYFDLNSLARDIGLYYDIPVSNSSLFVNLTVNIVSRQAVREFLGCEYLLIWAC